MFSPILVPVAAEVAHQGKEQFAYYLFLTLKDNSIVQTPEKLIKDNMLIGLIIISIISFIALSIFDITFIGNILNLNIPKLDL